MQPQRPEGNGGRVVVAEDDGMGLELPDQRERGPGL